MRSLAYNVLLTKDPKLVNNLFFDEFPASKTLSDVLKDPRNSIANGVFVVAPNSENSNGFLSLESVFDGENKSYVSLRMVETSQLLEFFTVAPHSWSEGILTRMKEQSIVLTPEDQLKKLAAARSTFYLSFGVGEDIRTWTGPFAINMVDSTLSLNSDGIRELEVLFTPTTDSLKAFTNKILNDVSYRSKDSAFSTIEAQSDPTKRSSHVTDQFNTTGAPKSLSKVRRSRQLRELSTGESFIQDVADIGQATLNLFGYKTDNQLSKGTSKYLRQKRIEELSVANQELLTFYGSEYGDEVSTKYQWNYAIRRLITKYLQNLFLTVPKGNILVLFDDDLDEKRSENPVIIEPFNREKKYKTKVVLRDIVKRCGKNLSKFGIEISYPKKGGTADDQTSDLTKGSILSKTTGKPSGVKKGKRTMEWVSSKKSNTDETQEYQSRDRNSVVLSMGVMLDPSEKDDSTPVLIKPLVKFQRRLSEVSKKPSDFTVYEETDVNVLRLLSRSGLIENPTEPVIIFGRKPIIDNLVYGLNPELAEDSLVNTLPNSGLAYTYDNYKPNFGISISTEITGSQFPIGFNLRYAESLERWRAYRVEFTKYYSRNLKSKVSSFGERIELSSKGFAESLQGVNKYNDPKDPINLYFAHNVTDGNVLDLSFDSKPYAGNLLGYANRPVYKLIDQFLNTSEYQVERDTSLNFPFIEYMEGKIKEIRDSEDYKKNPKKSFIKLFRQISESDKSNEAMKILADDPVAQGLSESDFFDLLILKLNSNAKGNFTVEQRADQGTIGRKEADLIRMINKSIINVNLRTLPFFNSNIRIGSRAFLYGNSNYIVGSNIQPQREKSAIFTNVYNVVGFKHYISKSDAYSEFTLVQDGYVSEESQLSKPLGEVYRKQINAIKGEISEREAAVERTENRGLVQKVGFGLGGNLLAEAAPEFYDKTFGELSRWVSGLIGSEEK